jgi:DNA-directed RNA polymerase specialized sigma24 family protein
MSVEHNRRQEFTEFYTSARDDCLRIVVVSTGDRQLAEDLVAEAFMHARSSLTAVKESLTDVRMDRSADTIAARARRRWDDLHD